MHIFSEGCTKNNYDCDPDVKVNKCCEGLVCLNKYGGGGYCSYPSMYIGLLLMMYAFYYGLWVMHEIILICIQLFRLDRKSFDGWAPSDTSGDFFGNRDFRTSTATAFSSCVASYFWNM